MVQVNDPWTINRFSKYFEVMHLYKRIICAMCVRCAPIGRHIHAWMLASTVYTANKGRYISTLWTYQVCLALMKQQPMDRATQCAEADCTAPCNLHACSHLCSASLFTALGFHFPLVTKYLPPFSSHYLFDVLTNHCWFTPHCPFSSGDGSMMGGQQVRFPGL